MLPNFSGTWKADFERCQLQIARPDATVFHIEHRDPTFRLERAHFSEGRTDRFEIELVTDGREIVVENRGRIVRCRLRWDGSELVLDAVVESRDERLSDRVRYRLSEDGRTLTARESLRAPSLRADNLWVLEKQVS